MLKQIQNDIEIAKNQLLPWAESFKIHFSKPKIWDNFYLEKFNEGYILYYLDERGGKNIISKTNNYDILKYKCFELLVQFCSSKYLNYALKNNNEIYLTNEQNYFLYNKQIEFMRTIAPEYLDTFIEFNQITKI